MKFGLRVPACQAPSTTLDLMVRAEQGGFDYLWLPDTQLLNREVWVTLGMAAARTSRIVLGTNVTNPLTRHASVTASAAATMQEATDGRFILGIGSGESSVRVMGLQTARLAEVREYVELMRALWEGQWVEPYGRRFHLQFATGRRVPVYIAASRPRMLQLAGEIADGVIMVTGISKDSLEYGLRNIEIGAERVGRRLEDLEIATGLYCHVGNDRRALLEQVRPYAALYALRYRGTERDFGLPVPHGFEISSLYPDLLHAEDWNEAIAATDWVSSAALEEFAKEWCLLGTGEEIAEQVSDLARLGVSNLYIRGVYTYALPTDVCEVFVDQVMPRFQ